MKRRGEEAGVVLVNVLVVLAIAGGLMVLLLSGQERATARISGAADAALAEQIALGAEASVLDALRRDLETAPETDHLEEPWARAVLQEEVALPTGRFSVRIEDMQARFDINQLADLSLGTQEFLRRLLLSLDQPPETVRQITRVLQALGPVRAVDDLADFGIDPVTLTALAPFVTALPVPGTVNLNTAPGPLLEVMLQNRGQAAQLMRMRARKGHLTRADLSGIGALRPQNSGFTSNLWRVEILAEAGEARLALESLILRLDEPGRRAVLVLERRPVTAEPPAGD
jgi:general secretion pathway protein K